MSKILVTGATGTVGREVVRNLCTRGVAVRAGVHTPEKARLLGGLDADIVPLEYREPETVAAALDGVHQLFLVVEDIPDHGEVTGRLAAAAAEAGVEHLVKLSAMGADRPEGTPGSYSLGRWHGDAEAALAASGLPHTLVRPNSFMQNFATFYQPRFGRIFLPMGDGGVSWVDARDVADVVTAALTDERHRGSVWEVTGPEALPVGQIAETLSTATGARIRYADIPEDFARKTMEKLESPEWFIAGVLAMHRANKAGEYATVTTSVAEVTGHEPRSFAEYVEDHLEQFGRIVS